MYKVICTADGHVYEVWFYEDPASLPAPIVAMLLPVAPTWGWQYKIEYLPDV